MMISLSELITEHKVRPKGIVHVGAHEAEELESYEEHAVPTVVWVEANPMVFRRLEQRLMGREHHRAFCFAAHELDGTVVELNVMTNTMHSSILRPKKHLEYYPEVTVSQQIQVGTRTLDSFLQSEQLDLREFNFLNMDIQGAELMALRGARKFLEHLDYIYTEINTAHLFEGCCLAEELDGFLAQHGFVRRTTRMTEDDWGDALYVRLH